MKILITGATNGMGKGVAKTLSEIDDQTHELILLCRSKELGLATIQEFTKSTGNTKVTMLLCDLTKLKEVKKTIEDLKSQHNYLDALFINAGIGYASKRVETEDGMDAHFQVNYLSQFMLTLNLLDLLERSKYGGRVIFNVTDIGEIFWDDLQLTQKWSYERGILQAMASKRMLFMQLQHLYANKQNPKIAFIGFKIHKTVWTNQLNIIPLYMKMMASLMRFFGTFISIAECGQIMAPLFTESKEISLTRSGKLFTLKKNEFVEIILNNTPDQKKLDNLWNISLELCNDKTTDLISKRLIP